MMVSAAWPRPIVLTGCLAALLAGATEVAAATNKSATLGVRVTVVDSCAATSAVGAVSGALGDGCATAAPHLTVERAAAPPTATSVAAATPIAATASTSGGTSYVTVVY